MLTKEFQQAFKQVDLSCLSEELGDCFCLANEDNVRGSNFEALLVQYERAVATFYKLRARKQLDEAQKNFKFMENL